MNAEPAASSEPANRVRELVERVLETCSLPGEVETVEDEEAIRVTVEGDDLGLLIGRRGQTIDALEHVAYRIAFRGSEERKRVIVDAAGYRERRSTLLTREADRAAGEAVEFNRPVALDAMTAAERRLVHEHLRDNVAVETYSEGEEPDRHLVVAPIVS